MKALNIIKYVFTIMGAVTLAAAFMLYSNTASFLERAIAAEGVVVELIHSRSRDSSSSTSSSVYYPAVQFSDVDDRLIEFRGSSGSNPPSYHRGERVAQQRCSSSPGWRFLLNSRELS